jgi:hypothetical protein
LREALAVFANTAALFFSAAAFFAAAAASFFFAAAAAFFAAAAAFFVVLAVVDGLGIATWLPAGIQSKMWVLSVMSGMFSAAGV